jgi:membrane fusion protein, multidrug efflux system
MTVVVSPTGLRHLSHASVALAFALCSLQGAAWAEGAAPTGNEQAGAPPILVEQRDVDMTYPAEAVVEATRQTVISAQVMGRIVDMRVDAGQTVRKGDLLLRIDERESAQGVASAEAGVAQAQANLANARMAYERTRSLLDKQFVSQAALDQTESAYKAAQAQLAAAQAGRGQASTTRSFTHVTSPLNGVVAARLAEQGDMASPGKQLVSLYDPAELRVVANIPQYKLEQVRSVKSAKVEFPDSGRWIDGASVVVLPTADPQTHTVRARVVLPAGTEGVVPGMFARVHFVLGRARKLAIPASAILRRGEVAAVYVTDAQGHVSLRQIRPGEVFGNTVEVLSGLSAGDRIAPDPVKAAIALRQSTDNIKK